MRLPDRANDSMKFMDSKPYLKLYSFLKEINSDSTVLSSITFMAKV